jgi:hypothetical protein
MGPTGATGVGATGATGAGMTSQDVENAISQQLVQPKADILLKVNQAQVLTYYSDSDLNVYSCSKVNGALETKIKVGDAYLKSEVDAMFQQLRSELQQAGSL